jgi:dTDP-3-amino-3,4,6-trideoxy-alpha-D-glucose transaminase
LKRSEIATGTHYPFIIPDQRALQRPGSFELAIEPTNARRLAATEVSLPIHPFLTAEEITAVINQCNGWMP